MFLRVVWIYTVLIQEDDVQETCSKYNSFAFLISNIIVLRLSSLLVRIAVVIPYSIKYLAQKKRKEFRCH
jgi:hypothetical protein